MTAREDAIEAGAKALDAKWGDVVWAMVVDEATTVVDAAEPIIRADEREKWESRWRRAAEQRNAACEELADLRERIAQEIERTTPRMKADRYLLISIEHAARIARGDS